MSFKSPESRRCVRCGGYCLTRTATKIGRYYLGHECLVVYEERQCLRRIHGSHQASCEETGLPIFIVDNICESACTACPLFRMERCELVRYNASGEARRRLWTEIERIK